MSRIRENAGTTYWYETPGVSLTDGFLNAGLSILTGLTATAKFSWDGSALSITDDNGTPGNDDLAAVRLLSSSVDLELTRQDGQAGTSTISIADGEVLWVELPDPLANTTYDGIGATSTNYRVTARGSVPLDDTTYWLAFREGSNIYIRGLGELEPGETAEVSDNVNENILTALGLTSETALFNYTSSPSGSLAEPNFNTSNNESAAARMAKLTAMLADTKQDFNIEIDPGTITWDGSNITVTSAQLSIPGTTIGSAPVSINNLGSTALADNSCLYVDINRTTAGALTLTASTLAALTPSQQRLVVARNLGGTLIVRD